MACDPPVKVVNTPPSGAEDQPMTEVANQVHHVTPQEPTVTEEGGKVEEIVNAGAANQGPDQSTAQIVASGSSQQHTGRFEEEIASTQQPPATITADHESVIPADGAKEHSIKVSFSFTGFNFFVFI